VDGIGIECVLAGAQATSVIDRASQGGSDWPRRARVEAGDLRAIVDAMATTRMRGDATMRRKYAELEKLTLAAGEQWQQTAFAAWARQSRGRELDPKVDDLQASTSSTSSVGLGGRITGESVPRAPMPQRVQRQAARCARALTGRPPEPSSRIKPRADSTSEVTMPFRRPNDMTAATGRGAERCWAGSAAVQESPSPLLHATRPLQQGRREGRCFAGLALDQGRRLSRGWLQQSWAATAASSATAPTSAFSSTACVLYTAITAMGQP
jgi:hypothetical protein